MSVSAPFQKLRMGAHYEMATLYSATIIQWRGLRTFET